MKVPKNVSVSLLITNPVLRPWLKVATANALADAFGCTNYAQDGTTPVSNTDPTVGNIIALTDKEIMNAAGLGKAAVNQVRALQAAVNDA